VNGEEVRDTCFVERGDTWRQSHVGGYDAAAVDDLLGRVADALDAGRPIRPLIENATFLVHAGRRRYDIEAVDWFVEQLLRQEDRSAVAGANPDPWRDVAVANQFTRARPGQLAEPSARLSRRARRRYLAAGREFVDEEFARAWRDFGQQPGMPLRWGETGFRRHELRTADRQPLAASRYLSVRALLPEHASLSTSGRTFTLYVPSGRTWFPAVAEIAARGWRDRAGHFAAESTQRIQGPNLCALIDETGAPIFHVTGINFDWRACARVTFPDQRWLRFLVRGTKPANAIMTAVDQAGNKIARYRISGPVEITLHPHAALTDELALAIAISAPFLGSYFEQPS